MAARATYRLSPLAETDIEEIWTYTVDTWSWEQAELYHDGIIAVLEDLASGRRIGREVDIRRGYLKYPAGSHFIFYRRGEAGIEVIRILHQRMDVGRYL